MSTSQQSLRQPEGTAPPERHTETVKHRRITLLFGGIGLVLVIILGKAIVGLAVTNHPTSIGGSTMYGADGSAWTNPPKVTILWLWISLMDLMAIFGLAFAIAASRRV